MAAIVVYQVRVFDILRGEYIPSRRMATRQGAQKMGGEVIEDTAVSIDESQLEPGEEWTPRDFRPS